MMKMKQKSNFKNLQKQIEKLLKARENELIENYTAGYKKLTKEIEQAYKKYEKNGEISLDDFRKYGRLKKIEHDTALIILSIYQANDKLIDRTLREIISITRKGSFEIINDKVSITPISKSFNITGVVNAEVAGRIWTERTKHYGDNFVYDLHSIIKQGLERGDTYTTMAQNLEDKFGKELNNPLRIARTEAHRVQEYTKYETMREIGQKVQLTKTWRTMKDERVRHSHQAMEVVEVGLDEEFTLPSGVTCQYPRDSGYPEEDINCRCWVEYRIKGTKLEVNHEEE